MPNSTKFEFCNCTLLTVTFQTIISTCTEKNWTLSPVKLIHKRSSVLMCVDRQRSAKLVGVGLFQKRHEQLTRAWSYIMLFVVCNAFNVLSCSHCFQCFSLLLPVLSFVKNFADPVTSCVRIRKVISDKNSTLTG